MKLASVITWLLLLVSTASAATVNAPHVRVGYEGIDATQAASIAETLSAAWKVYVEEFGFDLPETVICSVTCAPDQPTRLFTDGQDRITLTISSKNKLAPPASSGVFNLYGMCHELGHMAMYRTLKERDWMSSAAAEGWAHYAGSVVVDRVHAAKGDALWYEPYDYRQDGTARLKKQLASDPSATIQAAGQWMTLEETIGRRGFAKLFTAWQAVEIDPTNPDPMLARTLLRVFDEKADAVQQWWATAGPLLVEKQQASATEAATAAPSQLSGKPTILALDDDSADGRRSIAGGGHARTFKTPDPGPWYVCAVHVYGARYGPVRAPTSVFDIALCEPDLKLIQTWRRAYGLFGRGEMKWVRIPLTPTRVPREFSICLNFRPTATNGVYVAFDSSSKGSSVVGTPGKPGRPLDDGDWMIRVELDQLKK